PGRLRGPASGHVRQSSREHHRDTPARQSHPTRSLRQQRSAISWPPTVPVILSCRGRNLPNPCLVIKTLARIASSCNHLLLPSRMGERGAFGRTETRIWVDVSVSSQISRIALAPGIGSVADALVRHDRFTGHFHCRKAAS